MAEPSNMIRFLSLIGQLKKTKRTGWVMKNVKDPESVSDHMYRMSIMSMFIGDKTTTLKRDHCVKLCLVHDVAECIVGDITPHCDVTKEEKTRRENEAIKKLSSLIEDKDLAEEFVQLYEEYETQNTPEAQFVKDLDRFEMILQAFEYEQDSKQQHSLEEFFQSTNGKFKTKEVKHLVDDLIKTRGESKK